MQPLSSSKKEFSMSLSANMDFRLSLIITYHRSCRSDFTHKKSLQEKETASENTLTGTETGYRNSRRTTGAANSPILPDQLIFCKKTKYKPKSKTREKTQSCLEFRADSKVRESALLHIKKCTDMSRDSRNMLQRSNRM
jgi:hypothetical protein